LEELWKWCGPLADKVEGEAAIPKLQGIFNANTASRD
jgi:hypothetical protein